MGVRATDIAVERQFARFGGGLGHRKRNAENGIGAEAALIGSAVEFDHGAIHRDLIERVESLDFGVNLGVYEVHRFGHALAKEGLAAIAQLNRLMRAGGGARGDRGATEAAVIEHHIHFDRGVAAAVENLPSGDIDNGRHALPFRFGIVDFGLL